MTKGHKGDSLPVHQGPSSDLLALYLGSVVTLVRHCIHFFKWKGKGGREWITKTRTSVNPWIRISLTKKAANRWTVVRNKYVSAI